MVAFQLGNIATKVPSLSFFPPSPVSSQSWPLTHIIKLAAKSKRIYWTKKHFKKFSNCVESYNPFPSPFEVSVLTEHSVDQIHVLSSFWIFSMHIHILNALRSKKGKKHLSLCNTGLAHSIQPHLFQNSSSPSFETVFRETHFGMNTTLWHLHRASKIWKSVSQDGIIPIFRTMNSGRLTSFNTNTPEVSLKRPEATLPRRFIKDCSLQVWCPQHRPDQKQRQGCCDLVSGSLLTNVGHGNDARYLPLCFLLSKKERERMVGGREGGRGGQEGKKKGKKEKVLKYRQIRGTWKVISGIDASIGCLLISGEHFPDFPEHFSETSMCAVLGRRGQIGLQNKLLQKAICLSLSLSKALSLKKIFLELF